jgi:hypothetical protein
MHDQVFEFFEPMQMGFQLCVAPAGMSAHVPAAKTKIIPLHLEPLALPARHLVHQFE